MLSLVLRECRQSRYFLRTRVSYSQLRNENETTHEEVVQLFRNSGVIRSDPVIQTCLAINPRLFTDNTNSYRYGESGIKAKIDKEKVDTAANAMIAYMISLEVLGKTIKPGAVVMDVGTGSGFMTACMAHLVGPKGHVTSIDINKEVQDLAEKRILNLYPELHHRIYFYHGNALQYKGKNSFNAIHVGLCVPSIPPIWMSQLYVGSGMTLALKECNKNKDVNSSEVVNTDSHEVNTEKVVNSGNVVNSSKTVTDEQVLYYVLKNNTNFHSLHKLCQVDYDEIIPDLES